MRDAGQVYDISPVYGTPLNFSVEDLLRLTSIARQVNDLAADPNRRQGDSRTRNGAERLDPAVHVPRCRDLLSTLAPFFPSTRSLDLDHLLSPASDISSTTAARSLAEHEVFHVGVWQRFSSSPLISSDTALPHPEIKTLMQTIQETVLPSANIAVHEEDRPYWCFMVECWVWRRLTFPHVYDAPSSSPSDAILDDGAAGDRWWDLGPLFSMVAVKTGATDLPHRDWWDAKWAYTMVLALNGDWEGAHLLISQLRIAIPLPPGYAVFGLFNRLRHLSSPMSTPSGKRGARSILTFFTCNNVLPVDIRVGQDGLPRSDLNIPPALRDIIYSARPPLEILADIDTFICRAAGHEPGFWSKWRKGQQ
ncbi:hypothetical protein JCM10213v2_007504 [Rhodosporidiobolus nylandii]